MRKRPMCLACLLLLLGMLLFSSGASDKDADRKISGNDSVSVEGQVYKREEKANSLQIYLKNISIIQPGQTGSQNTSQHGQHIDGETCYVHHKESSDQ